MSDMVDDLLRYGLFIGAIFQMICIAAVIFIPPKDEGRDGGDSSDEDGISTEGPVHPPTHKSHGHHSGRRSRQEKKKRR